MLIQDFLDIKLFHEDEPVFIAIDPLVQFAHYVGEDGNPKRVRSMTRAVVPTFEWSLEEENDIIFRVMNEASKGYHVKAKTWSELGHPFWAKRRGNLSVFVHHPSVEGKFLVPDHTVVFHSEEIEPNRLLCVGPRDMAGTLLVQGEGASVTKNYVSTNPKGLLSVLILNP